MSFVIELDIVGVMVIAQTLEVEEWHGGENVRRGSNMVEEIGIRILVPIFVFGIIIVVGYIISDGAFKDVLRRREQERTK